MVCRENITHYYSSDTVARDHERYFRWVPGELPDCVGPAVSAPVSAATYSASASCHGRMIMMSSSCRRRCARIEYAGRRTLRTIVVVVASWIGTPEMPARRSARGQGVPGHLAHTCRVEDPVAVRGSQRHELAGQVRGVGRPHYFVGHHGELALLHGQLQHQTWKVQPPLCAAGSGAVIERTCGPRRLEGRWPGRGAPR